MNEFKIGDRVMLVEYSVTFGWGVQPYSSGTIIEKMTAAWGTYVRIKVDNGPEIGWINVEDVQP